MTKLGIADFDKFGKVTDLKIKVMNAYSKLKKVLKTNKDEVVEKVLQQGIVREVTCI